MDIAQIQLVDLFTRSVIKMVTLRSKPKRQYHPRGRHEGHNVQTFKTQRAKQTFGAVDINVCYADKAAVQFLCFVDAASVCGCSMFMLRCSLSR